MDKTPVVQMEDRVTIRAPKVVVVGGLLAGLALIPPPLYAQDPNDLSAEELATLSQSSTVDVIENSEPHEWRSLDPENTIYLELPTGRVILELAPRFAPRHVANIKALVRGGFFTGGAIQRSQDNYVAQWAPRTAGTDEALPDQIASSLTREFQIPSAGVPFTAVPDGDVYADEAGFVDGFPVGRSADTGTSWIAHCYGSVGVARGNDPDSGSGAALYAVIGHSPRHLDRNLTMVGRVVSGMEHLSSLPRGTGTLGFYQTAEERTVFSSVRMKSDIPPEERDTISVMRTDSPSFRRLIYAARSRTEAFFVHPSDRISVCNVKVPNRVR